MIGTEKNEPDIALRLTKLSDGVSFQSIPMNDPANQITPHDVETHVAFEVMGMMPKVRDDLLISVQTYAGETCYVIEDAISSKFFRLGLAEYTLVSLLDGKTTIAEAMGRTASITAADALSERETGTLCKWLLDSGLATTSQSRGAARLSESMGKAAKRKLAEKANPIMQKVPLFNPMPFLKSIDWISRSVFSIFGAIIWMSVVAYGGYQMTANWDDFTGSSANLLSNDNWLWLIVTFGGLKIIHELSHAMACRRFGGNVREAGVVFIIFAPMPYVDVTSSWRMDSKWKRILISAAGMYAEVFVAAIAAIVWASTFDPLVQQHCANIIVTATFVTLMFNANPLMRFDGYYILTDTIEMPNLAPHGRQWMSYFMRRYFMGLKVSCPQWPEGKHCAVVSYAILAFLWRILITISIALSAEVLFHGAGVVLAVFSIAMWIGIPAYKSINTLRVNSQASYPRMATITATIALTLFTLWAFVPWYSQASVPVVIDYHPTQEIRCGVSGFLVQCHVKVGDRVEKGDVLATLTNRELELESANLVLEIEQSRQRERDYRFEDAMGAVQVEQKTQASLQSRLKQTTKRIQSLTVSAPTNGIIAANEIESRQGTVLTAGDRLMVMGADDREMIYGLVDQSDIDAFRNRVGENVQVHVWGNGLAYFTGQIKRVLPRASNDLSHQALGAHAGGPLTVRAKEQGNQNEQSQVELIEPRFPIHIQFAGCSAERVLPGQAGYARLNYRSGTVGKVLIQSVSDWIKRKREELLQLTQVAQAEYKQTDLSNSSDHPAS